MCEVKRIRASMIATLSFFSENVYTAISFYWRNDTPSLFTWRNRLATVPDTPTCIVIHGSVHPPNQFVLEIVSSLPYSSGLVRHRLLFAIFFSKKLISLIGSLDQCHTSVFNALIRYCILIGRKPCMKEWSPITQPYIIGPPFSL